MEKIKTWRRFALALLSLLFVAIFSFALVQIIPTSAEEENVQITIHADANGSVKYAVTDSADAPTDEQYTQTIDANGSSEATIPQGHFLHLKATVSEEKAEDFLFRFWTVNAAAKATGECTNAVSMKIEDTFSFEECQEIANKGGLFANFTQIKLTEKDKWSSSKLKASYDDTLGKVYFFMGNPDATEAICEKHGLFLPADTLTAVSWASKPGSIEGTNITFAAIPNKDLQNSQLDPSKKTSVVFAGWSGNYYNGDPTSTISNKGRTYYPSSNIPDYCEDGSSVAKDWKKVGALWQGAGTSAGSYYEGDGAAPAWFYLNIGLKNSKAVYNMKGMGSYSNAETPDLYLDLSSLHANFQEIAVLPEISITHTEDTVPHEDVSVTQTETHIPLPYRKDNGITVRLKKFSQVETQSFSAVLYKGHDLQTGEQEQENITAVDVIDGIIGFTVSDIEVNSKLVITPDYGEKIYAEPIVIYLDIAPGEEDSIVASDSEPITPV